MRAIYQRELRRYFGSMVGWLLLAGTLLLEGLYFTVFHLALGASTLTQMLQALAVILIPLLPLLAVRCVTTDRSGAREAWLLSLPVPLWKIYLGKYLSMLTVFLLPTVLMCVFPLILAQYGGGESATAYVALLGYALMCAALLALLTLTASLWKRKRWAYLVGVGGMAVLYVCMYLPGLLPGSPLLSLLLLLSLLAVLAALLGGLSRSFLLAVSVLLLGGVPSVAVYIVDPSRFSYLMPRFLKAANPFLRFLGFTSGRIDLVGILFYLSLIAGALALTVVSAELRRRNAYKASSVPSAKTPSGGQRRNRRALLGACTAGGLAVVLVLQLLGGLLPYDRRNPSVEGGNDLVLSATAAAHLAVLTEDATVYLLVEGGEYAVDRELWGYLEDVATAAAGRITLEIVDTRETPEFASLYDAENLGDHSLIVVGRQRFRVIENRELYYYRNSVLGETFYPDEYSAALQAYQTGNTTDSALYAKGELLVLAGMYTVPFFDGDSLLVNALCYVTVASVPTVAVYRGSGCASPDDAFLRRLRLNCYTVLEVTSFDELAECDLVLMHAPATDLKEREATLLRQYLEAGGELFLTTLYSKASLPRLETVLRDYGISVGAADRLICEGTSTYLLTDSNGDVMYPFYLRARPNRSHPYLRNAYPSAVIVMAHDLALDASAAAAPTALLTTTLQGYRMTPEGTAEEAREKYTLAATAERNGSVVFWCGTPYLLDRSINTASADGNYNFVMTVIEQMTGTQGRLVELDACVIPVSTVMVDDTAFVIWGAVLVLALPLAVIATGWIRRTVRKRK